MSAETSKWKRPEEVMQLHRLKKKKQALQARMQQSSKRESDGSNDNKSETLDFSKLLGGEKRKNPFSKHPNQENKKLRTEINQNFANESNDSTLMTLLNIPYASITVKKDNENEKLASFANLFQQFTRQAAPEIEPEQINKKYAPVDWSLKTKLKFMSPKPLGWNPQLKASEEASGITGFVRCLDTVDANTLDTSLGARFHQNCLYWQHPHLPWVDLFPRVGGKVAVKSFVANNEEVKEALHKEWTESFRSLFQLLRARQCAYFYVCANTFTCLFRAAGISGISEISAMISPTTRGFRQILKQEDIEFSMPLRPDHKRKSGDSFESKDDKNPKNNSYDSCYDTMDDAKSQDPESDKLAKSEEESGDEEDIESDDFLTRLGLGDEEIKKINHSQVRVNHVVESTVDSAAESTLFIKDVEAQAFFNFLLNCKSIVSPVGPFGGIPPTLLAPTAFQGGTLQLLKVRENIINSENNKYYSVELRGPILPTTVHSLLALLKSNECKFSATFANIKSTVAFSRVAAVINKEETTSTSINAPSVFNRENLSDCGMNDAMLKHFCSSDPNIIKCIDSLKYVSDSDSYIW